MELRMLKGGRYDITDQEIAHLNDESDIGDLRAGIKHCEKMLTEACNRRRAADDEFKAAYAAGDNEHAHKWHRESYTCNG